ncbi:MAG: tetratricopeptide repeat protein [Planctomycetota bacterium]|nr:tetratricopeptide repeat protein [Planctomycetota bacterium]
MPNPFAPVPIQKESTGAKWRHPFEMMRRKWDKYFEVYPKELEGFELTTLDKVKAEPGFYLDRKVQFDIYYAKAGSFYRPFTSPFHQDVYVNFAGWPYGAELWTKEARTGVHPVFYVDKQRKALIDKLEGLPPYTPLHVWAVVRSKSENLAWTEVMGAEIIPEAVLDESVLRHIELGASQLSKKRFELAGQALEGALKLQLPINVEAKVYGLLGRACSELRQHAQARDALVNAVMRDEKNVANLVLLARTDLRIDKAAEGRQAAERAIALDPSNAVAHAELGLALAMLDDVRGGFKELDYAQKLTRNPLPEANRNRAVILVREGKLEQARDELMQAIIPRPTDVELKMELGDVYVALDKLDLAKVEYTQARELAPQRPEPYCKVATVLKKQGDAAKKDNKEDVAKKCYEEALENVKNAISKDDQYLPAYGLQAEILRALGKTEDAKKVLDAAAKRKRNDARAQEFIYQQAQALGDWDLMEQAARTAAELKPSAAAYSRLGKVLMSRPQADPKAAAAAYEEAVRLGADDAEVWAALGHLRIRFLGDAAGAEQALAQAVSLDPKNGGAWSDLALARRDLGKVPEAVAAADEAAQLSKSTEVLLLDALVHLDRGTPDDANVAADLAQKALGAAAADSEKALARTVWGAALVKSGKTDEAVEQFAKADALQKESYEYQLWYGTALMRSGSLDTAQEHLQAALNLSKPEVTTSRIASRVNREAERSLKTLQGLARAKAKATETEEAATKAGKGKLEEPGKGRTAQPSGKRAAPVIEEPEATPTQVPGPR